MKKTTIVFDLDGTLLNTAIDLANAVNYALYKNGFNQVTLNEVVLFTGKGMKKLVHDSLKQEVPEDVLNNVFNDFKVYYEEHHLDFTKPYDGVTETLKDLKNKGYKLAVVSNKNDEFTRKIVSKYFPEIVFDFVTGARENMALKPNKDLVELTLSVIDSTKEESVYIGDTDIDYNTAINSGLDPIIVSYGFRSREALLHLGILPSIDHASELMLYFKDIN